MARARPEPSACLGAALARRSAQGTSTSASSRRPRRAAVAAAVALSQLLQGIRGTAAQGVPLTGHSFGSPPDINALGEHWFLAGTVIPSSQSTVLQPGVPGRVGMLWSPHPLLTNNFEVKLRITVKAPEKRTATSEGFAFWYVYENATAAQAKVVEEHVQNQEAIVSNSWPLAMQANGFDLLGYRSKFNGAGLFVTTDAEGKAAVSAVHNDASKSVTLGAGIPAEGAPRIDRNKELKLTIRVEPAQMTVDIEGGQTVTVKANFQSGGYLGMTASGGSKGAVERNERCDFVELWDFQVTNLDKAAAGEKMPETQVPKPPPTQLEEKEDLVAKASSFKDHRAESDAIKDLTSMVFKLIAETQPHRAQLASAVASLSKRMTEMEATFQNLKEAIDKKTGHHLGQEFDAIKKELSSLSTVASKDTQERHKRLESLHEDIADVHKSASSADNIDHHLDKLTESNQRTLDSLTTEHQKMFGVSIAAIAFVIIAGLSLYNKFRCWEKKHVL